MVWNGVKFPDRITDAVKRSVLRNAIAGKPVRRRSSAMRLSRNTSIGETPFCETPYRTDSVRFFKFHIESCANSGKQLLCKKPFSLFAHFFIWIRKNIKKEAQGEENVSWQSQPPRPAPAAKGFFILTQFFACVNAFQRKMSGILLRVFRQSRALVY